MTVFSPAKINLFLGVTGIRKDGYHELLSLIVKLAFGDHLEIELVDGRDSLECDYPGLPVPEDNIIMKAITAFRRRYAFENGVKIRLDKRIPIEAGLGGGSSNAVAALKGLNKLLGGVLNHADLMEIAADLGSDCPVFLEDGPAIVRGRGEVINAVDPGLKVGLTGKRLLIFKPKFSVNTRWAFAQMALSPRFYIEAEDAEFILNEGVHSYLATGDLGVILYNNFEKVIFEEHGELGQLMMNLKKQLGVWGLLSGSGSACFCILQEDSDLLAIRMMIEDVLGKDVFIIETTIY